MAKRIRPTEEEEVVEMLKREGFKELTEKEIKKKENRLIDRLPECFKPSSKTATRGKNKG
jgi:hypothetical protein